MQDLQAWLAKIEAGNADFRRKIGPLKVGLFRLASYLLAGPRLVVAALTGRLLATRPGAFQWPWVPRWPGLAAKPVHVDRDHAWTERVRAARHEILAEMDGVHAGFARARYDSDENPKEWNTYYFYLQGKPIDEHLAACPRTAAILRTLPHNGLHICFSAIQPGGSLQPHTGPTNASLTAHLGLRNCAGTKLWVGEQVAEYRDGEVLVFDDSFVHWVENNGTAVRYTLMITFWHPSLTWIERLFLSRVLRLNPG